MDGEEQEADNAEAGSEQGLQAVSAFVRRNAYVIVVATIFGGAGIYYAQVFFPELPAYKAAIAGLFFGVFCTIVALGRRFL